MMRGVCCKPFVYVRDMNFIWKVIFFGNFADCLFFFMTCNIVSYWKKVFNFCLVKQLVYRN